MADVEFDGFEGGFGVADRLRVATPRFVNLAGAGISLALVIGLGFWGYKLAVRDVTGVPVIRAQEGPMRIVPQEPGGVITDHQGLAVNTVAAIGATSPPADRLILAPRPVALTEEDAPGTLAAQVAPVSGRLAQMPGLDLMLAAQPAGSVSARAADALTADAGPDAEITLTSGVPMDIEALVAAVVAEAGPSVSVAPEAAITRVAAVMPKGALATSLRPRARPDAERVLAKAAASVAAPSTESNGEGLAAGTRLVQLGAFDSEDVARTEWDKLTVKFRDILADKGRIVQAAQSGGRTFYRLRAAGFGDEADQRRFCSALVAEQAACIPVTVR